MEESETRFNELLLKYQQGECTTEEKTQLEYLYQYHAEEAVDDLDQEAYDSIKKEIWDRLPVQQVAKSRFSFLNYRNTAAAAALIAVLGAGIFFYGKNHGSKHEMQFKNDIRPGRNTAVLTLANGKKIRLDEAGTGTLASESGVSIIKTADGQLIYEIKAQKGNTTHLHNTLSTAKGETYQVRLPDGTMVWLNAASSLSYPSSFAKAPFREVNLTGEAYFEVSPNPKQPFVVKSARQSIEVLGTHFNINSYTDEPAVKTTLLEGSIKVSLPPASETEKSLYSSRERILKPGQQSLVKDEVLRVRTADIEQATDWKNGDFIFETESLDALMRRVSKWYNVNISYAADVNQQEEFTGKVSRKKNISEVLKALQSAGQLKFTINGTNVLIENQ